MQLWSAAADTARELEVFRQALQEEATQSNANNDSISRYLCHQRTFPCCAAGGGADGGGGGSGGGAAAELHLSSDLLSYLVRVRW